jgi:hypothetical protein
MLGQELVTNSRNRVKKLPQGLESQMQVVCDLAALASLWPEPYWLKSETEKSALVEGTMLSRCANSQCSRPFLRLRQGKLFLVETECVANPGSPPASASTPMRLQPRRVERYWLCEQCAEVWTLVQERSQGIELVPLRRPAASARVTMAEERRESA